MIEYRENSCVKYIFKNKKYFIVMNLQIKPSCSKIKKSTYYCSSYRAADPFSFLGTFSSSFIEDPVFHPIDDCEHSLLYLPGTGKASQETAISGSFQQHLADVCNSVYVWWLSMGWTPGGAVSGWSILSS